MLGVVGEGSQILVELIPFFGMEPKSQITEICDFVTLLCWVFQCILGSRAYF